MSLPANGILFIDGVAVEFGATFSQADIDSGLITYTHDGSATISDSFLFEVVTDAGAWLFGNTFNLDIMLVGTRELERRVVFDITPNPTDGLFTLYLEDNSDLPYQLSIFDTMGRMIDASSFSTRNGVFREDFDLTNYPSGVYFIRIVNGDKVGSRRVVVN